MIPAALCGIAKATVVAITDSGTMVLCPPSLRLRATMVTTGLDLIDPTVLTVDGRNERGYTSGGTSTYAS